MNCSLRNIDKLELLLLSLLMWEWVAEEPGRDKFDYPGANNVCLLHGCYLCEHTKKYTPCYVDWMDEDKPGAVFNCGVRCEHPNSPYQGYKMNRHGDPRLAQFYAKQVVELHKEAIRKEVLG